MRSVAKPEIGYLTFPIYHIIAHLIYDEKKVTKTQYKISSRPKREGAAFLVSNEQYIMYLIRLPYYTIWVLGNDNNIVISPSRYYFHIFLIFYNTYA